MGNALRRIGRALAWPFIKIGNWVRRGLTIVAGPPRPDIDPGPKIHPLILLESRPAVPTPDPPLERVTLAIDLGTSSCAVAMPNEVEQPPWIANLSVSARPPYEMRKTIGSALFTFDDEERILLDESWSNLYVEKTKTKGRRYHSVKRELFEHYHLNDGDRERLSTHLRLMYEELLWLALDPRRSSTVRALSDAEVLPEVVERWKRNGGLTGYFVGGHAVADSARIYGFDVCICVPNSLMTKDAEVLLSAATFAAKQVLAALRGDDDFDVYTPKVSMIREAEAVAWALPRKDPRLRGDVVIVDVGAGTTDAALVHYDRIGRGVPARLIEFRTGAPFGGDDVDMLLLCLAWEEERRDPTPEQKVRSLHELTADQRGRLIATARKAKESWTADTAEESIGVRVDPATAMPDVNIIHSSTALPNLYSETAPSPDGEPNLPVALTDAVATETYRHFLRYSTYLPCAALFRRLQGQAVTAVILTGQGSMALGLRQYVAALAEHFEVDVLEENIRHLDRSSPEAMKLVCAEGAAIYASEVDSQPGTTGDIIPETYVLYHDEARTDLFIAGSRNQRQQVNAMVLVDHPAAKRHVLRYYCAPEDLALADLTADWARRVIARIAGDPSRDALAFRLDLKKEQLDLWSRRKGTLEQIQYPPPIDYRGARPKHPFLKIGEERLDLTWQTNT